MITNLSYNKNNNTHLRFRTEEYEFPSLDCNKKKHVKLVVVLINEFTCTEDI